MREILLEELDEPFRLTFEKAKKAIEGRYFHYARSMLLSLLDHYPNCPALRLMLRQTALVTREDGPSMLFAWIKTLVLNSYHSFRHLPLKHLNRLERILIKRPDCLFAHRTLAHVALSKELWGTAALSLETVTTLDQKASHEQVMLANAYLKMGRVEDAQAVIKAILSKNPQNDAAGDLLKEASVTQTLRKDGWNPG